MSSLRVNRLKRYETHVWRVPRGASVFDQLLSLTLSLIAFSLPLEGVIENYITGNLRSLPFYLTLIALILAFLRLPLVIRQFLNNRGLLLITLSYLYVTMLYFANPVVSSAPTILIIQLLTLAAVFIYLADDKRLRRRLLFSYFLGWLTLVVLSFIEYQQGNVGLYQRGDILRVTDLLSLSANQHSRQIGVGIVLSLVLLADESNTRLFKVGIIGVMGLGSLVLLFGNSRTTILSLIIVIILFACYKLFGPRDKDLKVTKRRRILSLFFISTGLLSAYFIYTETDIGQMFLLSTQARFAQIEDGLVGSRDILWAAAIQIGLENPLGLGSNNSLYFIGERVGISGIDAHNYYLRMFVDGGFPGITLFLAGLIHIVRRGWSWVAQSGDAAFFFCFVFILVVSLSGINFHMKVTWFLLAMNAVVPSRVPTNEVT